MKTLILLFLLGNFAYGFSQDTLRLTASANSDEIIGDEYIPYIVGSKDVPGYDIEIRNCKKDETISLPNGRKIAGLNCVLSESEDYKGGLLTFDGDTTIIVDMRVFPVGESEGKFVVEGKDFSMSFTLLTGDILAHENRYCIFNTRGEGVWKIEKK